MAGLLVILFWLWVPAWAQSVEQTKVGALRFTSSGPLFLAQHRGYFRQEGLEVEIVFFDAAPSVTVAVASGSVAFGTTALTAAFYNLAAEGDLKILAGQAREAHGRRGNLILVSKRAFPAGVPKLDALFATPFGLTQFGSPSHYQLGQLARLHKVPLKGMTIRAFQTLPNLMAAIRGGHVAWAIIAPPFATDLIESGDMSELSPYSDYGSYQFGVVFTRTSTLEKNAAMAQRFVRAYKKGLQDYEVLNDAASSSAAAEDAARVVAMFVYPDTDPAAGGMRVRKSALYVDPTGAVDLEDIAQQIAWYSQEGLVKKSVDAAALLRLEYLR